MEPISARVTVVLDRPVAMYSGMVPGFVAGLYEARELEIDVVPLARLAGARVVLSRAVGVDPDARKLLLADRPPLRYDVASFDIGSTVAGLDLPGVRERAIPTRPIADLVHRAEEIVEGARRASGGRPFRLVVVGGGAGGVELAFTFEHRLAKLGDIEVTLVHQGPRLVEGYPERLAARLTERARARRIELRLGARVVSAGPDAVELEGGDSLPCDALVWVTGAVGQSLFRDAGLSTDDRGFVQVRPTLQVVGRDDLFAVGDCATMLEHPDTPKAGVYAVRQGPYLVDNLRAWVDGQPLVSYVPQSDFLTLLNLGGGDAIGAKWGRIFEGRRVMKLKDWIDRRFMKKFQVLDATGSLTSMFARMPAMDDGGPMFCGGCAAKVGQSVLDRALGRLADAPPDETVRLGLQSPDDASAYETPRGDVVLSSVDAFRAFTDDPYLVGRVAAVNAVSDLFAKGVRPRYALALVALPQTADNDAAEEMLYQVLAGARAAFDRIGVTLAGGHTTTSSELLVGFSVDGVADPERTVLSLDRLAAGQVLVLTKALGTGVVMHADMQGRARGSWVEAALESMVRDNAAAARAALEAGATAATDVTGFGLVGHLGGFARASNVSVTIDVTRLPPLPGALELLAQGFRSTFHPENERARRGVDVTDEAARDARFELLFDPQTSGGLVIALSAEGAADAVDRLRSGGDADAAVVGRVCEPRDDGVALRVVAEDRGLADGSGAGGE